MNGLINAWQPEIDWPTPAGQLLETICRAIPPEPHTTITLFGSALLQLAKANEIDVRKEIIAPVLERRRQGY